MMYPGARFGSRPVAAHANYTRRGHTDDWEIIDENTTIEAEVAVADSSSWAGVAATWMWSHASSAAASAGTWVGCQAQHAWDWASDEGVTIVREATRKLARVTTRALLGPPRVHELLPAESHCSVPANWTTPEEALDTSATTVQSAVYFELVPLDPDANSHCQEEHDNVVNRFLNHTP